MPGHRYHVERVERVLELELWWLLEAVPTPSRPLINIYVTDNCETIEESNDAKDNNDDDVDSFRDNLEGPKAPGRFRWLPLDVGTIFW